MPDRDESTAPPEQPESSADRLEALNAVAGMWADTPSRPLAFPPTVDPKKWEDFPVFRETFLSLLAPADLNAGFRSFAAALYSIVLESHGEPVLPVLPGEQVRHDLAAVAADLRHLQGFLGMVGEVCEGGQGETLHLGRFAVRVAARLAKTAAKIEGALG